MAPPSMKPPSKTLTIEAALQRATLRKRSPDSQVPPPKGWAKVKATFLVRTTFLKYKHSLRNVLKRHRQPPAAPDRDLFAVVIGVNEYLTLEKLSGASEDADAFADYLHTELHVPLANIKNLRNAEADRAGILQALARLGEDERAKPGDPLVIFFAGFTGRFDGDVAEFIPFDWSGTPSRHEKPSTGGISPEEINAALAKIQEKKGKNLALIIDGRKSKHVPSSGGATRGSRQSQPESANLDPTRPLVLIGNSNEAGGREDGNQGRFTSAFLKALRRAGAAPAPFTDTLRGMAQTIGQQPRISCGRETASALDSKLSAPSTSRYLATSVHDKVVVPVGSVAGITYGTEFTIQQKSRSAGVGPAMTCVAQEVAAFSSVLTPTSRSSVLPLRRPAYATATRAGLPPDVVVHFDPQDNRTEPVHEAVLDLLDQTSAESHRILLTENKGVADISLVPGEGAAPDSARVDILDERVTVHGFTVSPHSIPLQPQAINKLLNTAARFYRYINRFQANTAAGNDIYVEFVRLAESDTVFDDSGFGVLSADSDNLLKGGVAHIDIKTDDDDPPAYGIKITNHSSEDLYPSLFFCDNSDFSIQNYYPKDEAGEVIRKNGGSMTIGYGYEAAQPFNFYLSEGQNLDVGFLKLLFTTAPADLGHITQDSAFPTRGSGASLGNASIPPASKQLEGIWGSVLYTIVQRRVL